MAKPFRVLCLSGGGFLGLYSLLLLGKMEQRYGAPLGSHLDLVAGTSVGGLLAIAIALQRDVSALSNFFEDGGREVFRSSKLSRAVGAQSIYSNLFSPRFPADKLKRLVSQFIGSEDRLNKLPIGILVQAYNVSEGRPHEFRNRDAIHNANLSLMDIALATTAAPTYFPLHKIQDVYFADGGIHANTPDVLAISEALAEYAVPLHDIWVLSIGNTYSRRPTPAKIPVNAGIVSWFRRLRLLQRLLESQDQTGIMQCDRFLGQRYLRMNKFLSPSMARKASLARADDVSVKILRDAADDTWNALLSNKPKLERLDLFFDKTG